MTSLFYCSRKLLTRKIKVTEDFIVDYKTFLKDSQTFQNKASNHNLYHNTFWPLASIAVSTNPKLLYHDPYPMLTKTSLSLQ